MEETDRRDGAASVPGLSLWMPLGPLDLRVKEIAYLLKLLRFGFSDSFQKTDKQASNTYQTLGNMRPDPFMCRDTFFFFNLFILAALGLCCCTWVFSSYCKRGLVFIAVCGLLIVVASRCGARALGAWASVVVAHGLSSCGAQA